MPEPLYLLVPLAWAPLLVYALARLGFRRHGAIVHALALLATLALVRAVLGLWLDPLSEPGHAFAPVEQIVEEVDHWWALYLYRNAWPALAVAYFLACWLAALPFALKRRRTQPPVPPAAP